MHGQYIFHHGTRAVPGGELWITQAELRNNRAYLQITQRTGAAFHFPLWNRQTIFDSEDLTEVALLKLHLYHFTQSLEPRLMVSCWNRKILNVPLR